MSNDTFAATQAEIDRLQQRVNAQDQTRKNRHAEKRRLQAILAQHPISEGTLSAQRLEAFTRSRMPQAIDTDAANVYTLPRAALHRVDTSFCNEGKTAISSPCMAHPMPTNANQRHAANGWRANATPTPPTAPQDTLAERIKAEYLATNESDRKSILFVVGVVLLAVVCVAAITMNNG